MDLDPEKEQKRQELRAQADELLLLLGSGPHIEEAKQAIYREIDECVSDGGSDSSLTVQVGDKPSIGINRGEATHLLNMKMFSEFNDRIPLICDMFSKLELQPKPIFIGTALLMPKTKFQEILDLARDPSGGPAAVEALFKDVEGFVSHYFAQSLADRDLDSDRPDRRYRVQEGECQKRDGYKCVVTDSAAPDAFHIIPWSWNSTEDEIRATRRVLGALSTLYGQPVFETLERELCEPGYTHSSDRAWNMVCLTPTLATWVGHGYCGFEPINFREENDHYVVGLVFRWINLMGLKLSGNLKDDLQKYADELAKWESGEQKPVPSDGVAYFHARTGARIRSGRYHEIKFQHEIDAYKFYIAMAIQWNCVKLQSLCGSPECDGHTEDDDSSSENSG
ncbi:hypothetical protein B0I35DRAFT_440167 [Stachybotrys elegans]|uniref:HNH nuclease domain-containing protein n=1 Tax=Stachybotrys elegans TaxID=80388 RepID=A0A8K0SE13_9HYPO|nr:hypothetical protein B0I35DRAFT_440167 [Stachybotrys elegans]